MSLATLQLDNWSKFTKFTQNSKPKPTETAAKLSEIEQKQPETLVKIAETSLISNNKRLYHS
jgi:hypothetical protein